MYSTSSIALVVLYTIARMVWDGGRCAMVGVGDAKGVRVAGEGVVEAEDGR